ncbi:cell wall hydrolase [Bacteroides congonensis]|uniref:cell wall hydrolase n=1 Tax=Bacteroides congonensis TaxID=1871006 RepID=UPI003219F119
MYRRIRMLLLLLIFCVVGNCASVCGEIVSVAEPVSTESILISEQIEVSINEEEHSGIPAAVEVKELLDNSEEAGLSEEDIDLIALVTMAEAEGESEYGKRLVIDTVLNRIDSEHYPDTVFEVVYQPSQFSSMWNGRVDRCCVTDEICQLVREELLERQNYEVIFFTAGGYGKYGTPMFQEGNHYFSSYE